jgi:hypothetical protein
MKTTFDTWMQEVDRAVARKCGMSVHDLDDAPYADWHEDGLAPKTAAARAIKRSGGEE